MTNHRDRTDRSSIPVAPSMEPAAASVLAPLEDTVRAGRLVRITGIAILLGIVGGVIAKFLLALISLITHLIFSGEVSTADAVISIDSPTPWILLAPVAGAVIIGLMARFGSRETHRS